MTEIRINKEITDKTQDGIEYKIKNLTFTTNRATLFGTMIINGKDRDFYIDFENGDRIEYGFKEKKVEKEFKNTLIKFYSDHIVGLENVEQDKDENMVLKRRIKIK